MYKEQNPLITLGNGLQISIQASRTHYCEPRKDYLLKGEEYTKMEIGPIKEKKLVPSYIKYYEEKPYSNTKDPILVFPYVPVDLIKKFIQESGGIVKGCLPTGER